MGEELEIDNVSRSYYRIEDDTIRQIEVLSRAADNDSVFNIATVEFHNGDKKGYAVLSDDERVNKVFYFTDNGSISDTAYIGGLKDVITAVPGVAGGIIIDTVDAGGLLDPEPAELLVSPIVKTQWGQYSPYNRYAKACSCADCSLSGGHMPIGCVATAVAQTIAKCGKFTSTFYGSKDINFASLTDHPYPLNSTEDSQVAHFFHEIALCCNMKFGCDGSSTSLKSAYQYLIDLGYSCTFAEGDIDIALLLNGLNQGFPHIMRGVRSGKNSGHAWIVDGIMCFYRINGDDQYSFHCNWGWDGRSDGWSLDTPNTPLNKDAYSEKNKHIYITSIN